ncbi:hypothetical protein TNCV_5831 [Trichonephila clavipes]|nr:hypothetical protein TNCV_5831 [Trichonephila clavipes]
MKASHEFLILTNKLLRLIRCAEGLMRVKLVETQIAPVDEVWNLGDRGSSSDVVILPWFKIRRSVANSPHVTSLCEEWGTRNSRRVVSPLVRLVKEEERWVAMASSSEFFLEIGMEPS